MHIPTSLDYQPHFPSDYRPGIGIIGCGAIVRNTHLPAYAKHQQNVVGAFDINADNARLAQQQHGFGEIFGSLDELLARPDIQIVDIATHPDQRIALMRRALAAGKHILAQKPLATTLADARAIVAEGEASGLTVAVNQNGRWAPPWRIATLLIEQGIIGDVLEVTHFFDTDFSWVAGTGFDTVPHWAIYDYAIHWIDISRCWLDGYKLDSVRAREYRTPGQPATAKAARGMWVEIASASGANAMIRSAGTAITRRGSHQFWIHGSSGTIRGSVLGQDFVEVERDGKTVRYALEGVWFPDGFAGTMGELQSAIVAKREPYNSARNNLLTLELTLAACASSEQDGAVVAV